MFPTQDVRQKFDKVRQKKMNEESERRTFVNTSVIILENEGVVKQPRTLRSEASYKAVEFGMHFSPPMSLLTSPLVVELARTKEGR